ncbi:30S ribosomal protein S9 [Candidatus Endomicrobiellum devescovinae]|jgi:small subunit ribosomal protein S9|uniref:30S ribosomal protein S9 n=1 Tax=Candidatus Endomicrobiellum devescovinae TaxID=3242322 RepID=UPI002822CD01|nr:30S ribosomal protein S9 [Endomicrobium sp.]MDR2818836.1 30S ribosomal protein S9 [Endomicrobium sp.]
MSNVSYLSAGRRKNAIARTRVANGNGKIIINNKTVDEYFGGLERLKKTALKPLGIWEGVKNYDFFVNVNGGGVSGQAGAISHSIARTILELNEASKAALKKEGLLTRDSRMVERKKPGRPKARKRFQFSKR